MSLYRSTGWRVGDTVFDNKWDAIQCASTTPQPYHAYCNDDTWNDADWTAEPDKDMEQLQKEHAEYLRNKYKTLVLFYSGGVDSSTVLNTFIKNKIPLDYIFVWYVNDPAKSYNKDVHLAMQYLEENKSKLMGAKIYYEKKLEHFEGNSIYNFKKPICNVNFQLRFHHNGNIESLELRQPEICNAIKQDGCIITGSNKPYVYKDDNGFYMRHIDVEDENWGQPHTEMFWLGKDPTLQIKQCHLAKQWLLRHNSTDTNTVYKSEDTDTFWDLNQSFGRESINEFFYQKHCFSDQIDDEYFSQKYGRTWGNSHWANYFKEWQYTESYYELKEELDSIDKKFVDNYQAIGWITEKRYLD